MSEDKLPLEPLATAPAKTAEEVNKTLHDIVERVNVLTQRGEDAKVDQNVLAGVKELAADLKNVKDRVAAIKSEVPESDVSAFNGLGSVLNRLEPPTGINRTFYNLISQQPAEITNAAERAIDHGPGALDSKWAAKLRELQSLNDAIIFADLMWSKRDDHMSRGASRAQRMAHTRMWRDFVKLTQEFQRVSGTAVDTATADQGLEWIPTLLSSQLTLLMQPELQVSNLFATITMPGQSFVLPVMGADNIAYLIPENVEDATGTAITKNTFLTKNVTMSAKKLASGMAASSEALEEGVIAMTPLILKQLAKCVARAREDALINGDVTGTHQDNDTTAATDRRKIWRGLRKQALSVTSAKVDAGATSPTVDRILAMKQGMGVYGTRPQQGTFIVGYKSLIGMMLSSVGGAGVAGNYPFIDASKYGGVAGAQTGELGRYFGSPVILSEFMREDLDATGVNSATGGNNIKTALIYVNTDAFTQGERRGVTIKRSDERNIEYDQSVFFITWRGDFKSYYVTTDATAGIVFNIA